MVENKEIIDLEVEKKENTKKSLEPSANKKSEAKSTENKGNMGEESSKMNEDDAKDMAEDAGGKNTAEKILNDIISGIKIKQEEFGKTISDYKTALQKPLTDVIETESSLIIKIDLPGVEKENIDLGITEDGLEIKALFEEEIEDENVKYLQKERSHGKTIRSMVLPVIIDTEKVTAKFNGSVLTVELPKLEKEVHKVDIV